MSDQKYDAVFTPQEVLPSPEELRLEADLAIVTRFSAAAERWDVAGGRAWLLRLDDTDDELDYPSSDEEEW